MEFIKVWRSNIIRTKNEWVNFRINKEKMTKEQLLEQKIKVLELKIIDLEDEDFERRLEVYNKGFNDGYQIGLNET